MSIIWLGVVGKKGRDREREREVKPHLPIPC